MRAVDEGLEGGEVDLDDLVEKRGGIGEDLIVGTKIASNRVGGSGNIGAACRGEVARHCWVVGEQ